MQAMPKKQNCVFRQLASLIVDASNLKLKFCHFFKGKMQIHSGHAFAQVSTVILRNLSLKTCAKFLKIKVFVLLF